MWEFLMTDYCVQGTILTPKMFFFAQFYKNFVSSLGPGCFGIWYSAEISVFSNVFGFSSGKLGSKIDQNCWLWVCRIGAKIQNFSRSFKHCVYLIRDKISKPLVKISARSINIWGSKSWKFRKRGQFMMVSRFEKLWKF